VVLRPWRAEWEALKAEIRGIQERRERARAPAQKTKLLGEARGLYADFRARLGRFRVLDPACGSGNFLALALAGLKDFDLVATTDARALDLPPDDQRVGPDAALGIEINPYAAELARLTVWITELQWQLRQGFGIKRSPILGTLDGIVCKDALVTREGAEASWPEADVVVGNPPFLGGKRMYRILGTEYTHKIRGTYRDRVSPFADLVCFWFENAHRDLDAAVAAAYGWPADIAEEDALARLLALNRARANGSASWAPRRNAPHRASAARPG